MMHYDYDYDDDDDELEQNDDYIGVKTGSTETKCTQGFGNGFRYVTSCK